MLRGWGDDGAIAVAVVDITLFYAHRTEAEVVEYGQPVHDQHEDGFRELCPRPQRARLRAVALHCAVLCNFGRKKFCSNADQIERLVPLKIESELDSSKFS